MTAPNSRILALAELLCNQWKVTSVQPQVKSIQTPSGHEQLTDLPLLSLCLCCCTGDMLLTKVTQSCGMQTAATQGTLYI